MSASLVGSEMCIRDRHASTLHSLGMKPHGMGAIPAAKGANESPGLTPVSYTHLTLPTICSV
eukprot:5994550-Alexandrium_andersonii.AAC.1